MKTRPDVPAPTTQPIPTNINITTSRLHHHEHTDLPLRRHVTRLIEETPIRELYTWMDLVHQQEGTMIIIPDPQMLILLRVHYLNHTIIASPNIILHIITPLHLIMIQD
jgi:hypothetical protein